MLEKVNACLEVTVWLSNNLHKLFNLSSPELLEYTEWDIVGMPSGTQLWAELETGEEVYFTAEQIAAAMEADRKLAS